ncbi:serine hydrolase domain-containing protein [Aeromicrobium sp. NPDC092404]|uniref:serine hydrolase domain-containing protein n=1 Tax=Aeromicrobium sp. NPDC092404 TaxID=3154976 RepID=UPI003436799C
MTRETDWSSIGDLVQQSVEAGTEVGAGVSVWHDGAEVVNLAVGTRNAAGDPWQPDTLAHTYSVAKPFAALTALSVVAEGAIGLDQPIADVWPEFSGHGKAPTTLRHVLSHQSGLFAFPDSAASIDPLDGEALVELLAEAAPFHPPGQGIAEHALTYGHLLHGVVQRATGQGLADRFAELAAAHGWDLHLSVPEADLPRVADLTYARPGWAAGYLDSTNTALTASLGRPAGPLEVDVVNGKDWRSGWFPAIALHATAPALARFYAELLDPDGPVARLLGPELLREYTSVQATGHDLVLDREATWTLGFQRDAVEIGMGGIGGSSAWFSTAKGYACAYVTRGLATHDRVDAVWEEIERLLPGDILDA